MSLLKAGMVPAITAKPEDTVAHAIGLMVEHEVGAITLVDASGAVAGIFTERDNMVRVTLARLHPEQTPLKDVMHAPVVTATPDYSIDEALALMLRTNHRHLPVVDKQNRPVAYVSMLHLLKRQVADQHHHLEVLGAYVLAGGPG